MAIYDVAMGQAIAMRDLGTHTLSTGNQEVDDQLSNCSAVILTNPTTNAAALYHFPSGNIADRPGAQALLREVIAYIHPTECHVLYGTGQLHSADGGLGEARHGDPDYARLVAHLRGLTTPLTLAEQAAPSGSAIVFVEAGTLRIRPERLGLGTVITNLAGQATGDQTHGRLYFDNYERDRAAKDKKKKCFCIIL